MMADAMRETLWWSENDGGVIRTDVGYGDLNPKSPSLS